MRTLQTGTIGVQGESNLICCLKSVSASCELPWKFYWQSPPVVGAENAASAGAKCFLGSLFPTMRLGPPLSYAFGAGVFESRAMICTWCAYLHVQLVSTLDATPPSELVPPLGSKNIGVFKWLARTDALPVTLAAVPVDCICRGFARSTYAHSRIGTDKTKESWLGEMRLCEHSRVPPTPPSSVYCPYIPHNALCNAFFASPPSSSIDVDDTSFKACTPRVVVPFACPYPSKHCLYASVSPP